MNRKKNKQKGRNGGKEKDTYLVMGKEMGNQVGRGKRMNREKQKEKKERDKMVNGGRGEEGGERSW